MMRLSLMVSGSGLCCADGRFIRIDRLPRGPLLPRWIGTPFSTCSGVASPSVRSIRRIACRHSAAVLCLPVFRRSSSSSTVMGMAT